MMSDYDGAAEAAWRQLYGKLREHGALHRFEDRPYPGDEQLWTLADTLQPGVWGTWEQVQEAVTGDPALSVGHLADQVEQLQQPYDEGYRPEYVDLRAVCALLQQDGITAAVQHDGGGGWLLHAGPWFVDGQTEDHVGAVTAGPGYEHKPVRGRTIPVLGSIDEFSYGTGDTGVPDGDRLGAQLPARAHTSREVADLIAAMVDKELVRRGYKPELVEGHDEVVNERVVAAVADAERAFWDVVADRFPEITGGDVDPGRAVFTETAMRQAVESWIEGNQPDGPWTALAGKPAPVVVEPSREQQQYCTDLIGRASVAQRPGGACRGCGALDKTCCDCAVGRAHLAGLAWVDGGDITCVCSNNASLAGFEYAEADGRITGPKRGSCTHVVCLSCFKLIKVATGEVLGELASGKVLAWVKALQDGRA